MDSEPNGSQRKNIIISSVPTTIISTTHRPTTTTEPTSTTTDPKLYYQSYDVMTGVRIAATLGGFFGLMVILVLYKSKSKTEKALEDPDFTAAAVAEVEEEERQLQAVLEASAYQQLNPRRVRRSLDTTSIPPGWNRDTARFSSVGGYSSLLEPPTRTHSRLPSFIDEDSPPEYDKSLYDDVYYNEHLDVPRRPSNITCSSSGSSYLERRDSAVALGLPALPAHKCKSTRRQSSPLPEIYDFYYPIDIRVTQPTPGGSPCGSDRALYDRVVDAPIIKPKLAPLASISSCNSSLATDYPEFDIQSYASDSVFNDEDDDDNTENEADQFSTDSEINSDEGACYSDGRKRRKSSRLLSVSVDTTPLSEEQPQQLAGLHECNKVWSKSSSTLVESAGADDELPQQFSLTDSSVQKMSISSGKINVKNSWAQETLF